MVGVAGGEVCVFDLLVHQIDGKLIHKFVCYNLLSELIAQEADPGRKSLGITLVFKGVQHSLHVRLEVTILVTWRFAHI